MMAKKALLAGDLEHYVLIMHESDPSKCKQYGKAVRNLDVAEWNRCKRYSIDTEKRYILMDLYKKENVHCISQSEQTISVRCHDITFGKHENGTQLIVIGTLK